MLFHIDWNTIEEIKTLDRPQMEAAAVSVRGMAPNALDAASPDATFVRIRFEDERGWWQHLVLELTPPHGEEQRQELLADWERHRRDDKSSS